MLVRTCGAHTELIATGPEVIHMLILFWQKWHLPLRKISWPIQPDVVKVHLSRTTGDRDIAFRTQANRYACSSEGVSFVQAGVLC